MVEAKKSYASTSRNGHFLQQIYGMNYMEYTQEEQCPILQDRSLSTHSDIVRTLWLRRCKTEYIGI